uniref:hypothetical protein n=1 Tax=Leisingera sp. ANG-M1 TaxID=1577895 RepID=UPI001F4C88A5|nr:hypothetical protein [Leisingera sp. ANG-M1]
MHLVGWYEDAELIGNYAIRPTGFDAGGTAPLDEVLASDEQPFSILTPGLSGISMGEEWRTKAAMDAAVMHGDANLYLRTVLDHLLKRDLDEGARTAWLQQRSIDALPKASGWKAFAELLDRCYDGARVLVKHDPHHDRFINAEVETPRATVTLDMASTGMLQVIQIVAYVCFYAPPLATSGRARRPFARGQSIASLRSPQGCCSRNSDPHSLCQPFPAVDQTVDARL